MLRYRAGGKRRWFVAAHVKNSYVWQHARFDGDIDFWRAGLSRPEDVKPVKRGECLRLFLVTEEDFKFFHRAATEELQASEWVDVLPSDDEEANEDVSDSRPY